MKIGEIFADNTYLASLKIECKMYGITMPRHIENEIAHLLRKSARFVVFIGRAHVETLEIAHRSDIVGKIVGMRLRQGKKVYFFHDGAMRLITWENWKKSWAMLTPKPEKIVDDRIRVRRRERTMFEDAMPDAPHKKMSKRGFSRLYNASESMHRMQSLPGTQY